MFFRPGPYSGSGGDKKEKRSGLTCKSRSTKVTQFYHVSRPFRT